jgi:hypothetical protein
MDPSVIHFFKAYYNTKLIGGEIQNCGPIEASLYDLLAWFEMFTFNLKSSLSHSVVDPLAGIGQQ